MPTFTTTFTAVLAAALLSAPTTLAAHSPPHYNLVTSFSGSDFFTNFSFWDQPDPTNGFVSYQSASSAAASGLAGYIFNNATGAHTAYLGVDHETLDPEAGRASVRVTSQQAWSGGGLWVVDLRHMPAGVCGAWPALWLVGPDWPHNGEIDIVEGVNTEFDDFNSLTLHTGPGCESHAAPKSFLGEQVTTDCDVSSAESNTGCSVQANASRSLDPHSRKTTTHATSGAAFNAQGGGVYATIWDASGIKIWMFPHAAIPSDLASGAPNPASWTAKPLAAFGGQGCDYTAAFSKQQLVIDTTFCGDWAGKPAVWANSTCAAKAPTCQAFVAGHPEAFREAFWEIASIEVYQTSEQQDASGTRPIAKRHEADHFPAALGEIMPHGHGDEPDCPHMAAAANSTAGVNATTNANSTAPLRATGTFPTTASASASLAADASAYGNSTGFAALKGRFAKLR